MTFRISIAHYAAFLILIAICFSCQDNRDLPSPSLFTSLKPGDTGVDFVNTIQESEQFNYYTYIYSYIGGGISAADFNNDGLVDLFFTSNAGDHKLYLNMGELVFEDITDQSGIEKLFGFNTGTTTVDINNDGFTDIYVCRAGWTDDNESLRNLLYINNGDLTFTEQAKDFGVDDDNRSISATFFDYDRDSDLDLFVTNSSLVTRDYREIQDLDSMQKDPRITRLKSSDRLYECGPDGTYKDVSLAAGIYPERGFGLNSMICDLNNDGWSDIYVSNDFEMPDFAYLNNRDGTFTEARDQVMKHMSYYSMGSDYADINNDGLGDLFVLDMNPQDYIRSKTTMAMTSPIKFRRMVTMGYHFQYMHNVLQLNNGNGTYSEIAHLAGVASTDWSWAPLAGDFDLDGYVDLYVTNGVYRDVIDQDRTQEIREILYKNARRPTSADFLRFTQMLPQQKLRNYVYKNLGDLTFEDKSLTWIITDPSFSNGAAYADLDNDGDLEIIVNNINQKATVLKNNAVEQNAGHYLQISLQGPDKNRLGVGATVNLTSNSGKIQTRQLINSRGYLSSVSNKLHFGIRMDDTLTRLEVIWPDGKSEIRTKISPNQHLLLDHRHASAGEDIAKKVPTLLTPLPYQVKHTDPYFDDFQKQVLLPHQLSQTGPAVAKADINGDKIADIFIGGARGYEGQLLLGEKEGGFIRKKGDDFVDDLRAEDVGAAFFDADQDGDSDLYVVSGSYEYSIGDPNLQDRLYLNDGAGHFQKATSSLPLVREAGSIVRPADLDLDGDIDLFVGGRVIPGKYPRAPESLLLINEGGHFLVKTPKLAPELQYVGMVTDATWVDIDLDGDLDLIVVGEWMGIEVFLNNQGFLERDDRYAALAKVTGWWNRVIAEDINGDGLVDLVAGNLGLNSKLHASNQKPFHVYAKDFDFNGTEDVFLVKYYKDRQVPLRGKTCTAQQMPSLLEEIPTYRDFASRDIAQIVGPGLASATHQEVTEFRSGTFINEGAGHFHFEPFPNFAQQSPISGILYTDVTDDKIKDLVLAGNNFLNEIETTRSDAGIGIILKGQGKGKFSRMSHLTTGFLADKDVRHLINVETSLGRVLVVINNNDAHQFYQVPRSKSL